MLVRDLKVSGGFQKLVLRLAQELKKLNHEVIVYTPFLNKEGCYPDFIGEINIIYGENTQEVSEDTPIFKKIKTFYLYFKLIIKYKKSDVIIVHDPQSLFILNFINTKNTKVLWMLNNQFPDFLQTKYVDKSQNLKRQLKKIFFFLVKRGLNKVDTLLTYDRYNYDLVKKYTNKNVEIVYAGADIETKDVEERNEIKGPIKLISVGVLFDYRRYEDIIDAMYLLKQENINTKLHIVGETKFALQYLKTLKDLIDKYNLKNEVIFTGPISDSQLDSFYRTSDAFIFVNSGQTWGISVFEAMSYKLPTIISNNIGAIDLIKDENCSFVVNPKSPIEIAKAIKQIRNKEINISQMIDNYQFPLSMVRWDAYTERILKSIINIRK